MAPACQRVLCQGSQEKDNDEKSIYIILYIIIYIGGSKLLAFGEKWG